jgi:predicted aldo/keto reductase-like oxidoreductase
MLHYVDEPDDYDRVFGSGGILETALHLKHEGKARCIGMSSHRASTALRAVNSGSIDVLLFPVNPAYDALPSGAEMEAAGQAESYQTSKIADRRAIPERVKLYHACELQGVGLIAMKPYAAGQLFARGNPSSMVLTPVQCISYAFSQPGVCTVVPGCRNVGELNAALAFLEATDEEKDYSAISENPVWMLRGRCMYCNHCLPCPVGIDIGTVTRLMDTTEYELTDILISEYNMLPSKASACNECGICLDNCPFGVDITANMARAVEIFGE